jgi:hypothetical protein
MDERIEASDIPAVDHHPLKGLRAQARNVSVSCSTKRIVPRAVSS